MDGLDPLKICLAASAGGHLTQLLRLIPACEDRDYFIVTTGEQKEQYEIQSAPAYSVSWANRNHPLLLFRMVRDCLSILKKERPDVLISTGAAVGCVMAILMKARGQRVIWIDTISHTEYLTMSGRLVRFVADVFLVQWPDLALKYKGAKYRGSVI